MDIAKDRQSVTVRFSDGPVSLVKTMGWKTIILGERNEVRKMFQNSTPLHAALPRLKKGKQR